MKSSIWLFFLICVALISSVHAGDIVNEKDGRVYHQRVYQRDINSKVAELVSVDVIVCKINPELGTEMVCMDNGKKIKTNLKEVSEAGWSLFFSSDSKDGTHLVFNKYDHIPAMNKNGLWVPIGD